MRVSINSQCYPEILLRHPYFKAYLALAAVCFFWGTTYLGIRMAVESMPPAVLVSIRYLISGSVLLLAAFLSRAHLPSGQRTLVHGTVRRHHYRDRKWLFSVRGSLGSERTGGTVRHHLAVLDDRDGSSDSGRRAASWPDHSRDAGWTRRQRAVSRAERHSRRPQRSAATEVSLYCNSAVAAGPLVQSSNAGTRLERIR